MRSQISQRQVQRGCLGLLSGVVCSLAVACQSSPAESREPVREPPSAAAPPTAPAAQAQPPPAGNTAPAAKPPALNEPAAVKLTGAVSTPTPAAASPVAAADAPSGKAPEGKAAPGPAKSVQGAAVSEEAFSIWLQGQSPAKAGSPVQLEAVLVAKPPYHCNAEYPHKFKLNAAPAGLSYPEETVKGMKVTPERSVLAIPVNAQSAGKPTVSGTLSFSVCTEERCMVEKRDLTLALDVM
jgi:hypothetical protein